MYMYVHTCTYNMLIMYKCTCTDVDVTSKELAAHKEMVAELRSQLAEKENEFQVTDTLSHKIIGGWSTSVKQRPTLYI